MTKNKKSKQIMNRIVIDPQIMIGKPVIKGTRLTVQFILGLIVSGASFREICEEYSGLTKEDIEACVLFAIQTLDSSAFLPLSA